MLDAETASHHIELPGSRLGVDNVGTDLDNTHGQLKRVDIMRYGASL